MKKTLWEIIYELFSKPELCPTCRRWYKDKANKTFIHDIGECGTCDHVRGEVMDDQRYEAEQMAREMEYHYTNNKDPQECEEREQYD